MNKIKCPTLSTMNTLIVSPQDKDMTYLLGGRQWGGLIITEDQYWAICKWAGVQYKFPEDTPGQSMMEADASVTAKRMAQKHGMRMVAYLAKFLEPGEDPVKYLHGLLMEAGCDVPCWDEDEEE